VARTRTNGGGTRGRVAAGVALLGSLGAGATGQAATFKQCPDAKLLQRARVAVPLDRSGRVEGAVDLAVR